MKNKIFLTGDLHYGFSYKTHDILQKFYEKIEQNNPDYFIICGDIISHKQTQWEPSLKQLRKNFDCPILVVLGNHDLWQHKHKTETLWELKRKILTKFKEYDITYLPHEPIINEDFKIYGFDGWYGKTDPPSRDLEYMPHMVEGINTHEYLRKKSGIEQMGMIPEKTEVQQIVVTHFDYTGHPMSAEIKWLDILNKKCDVLCVGHSHKQRFDNIMDMQIINSGSDYDKPDVVKFYGGRS